MTEASLNSAATAAAQWTSDDMERLLTGPASRATGWSGAPPAGRPFIPFTAGVPDSPTFPVKEIGDAVQMVLKRHTAPALEYLLGTPGGLESLRRVIIDQMEPEPGLTLSEANVTITSGSAQAFANVVQTLIEPGDTVIVEAPTYGGAVRTVKGSGGRFEAVAMDAEGMRMDALTDAIERLAEEGRRAKFIYTIPTFHNPAGVTMPVERRRQLIEIAARHRVLIVEDDAYGELRFRGEHLPSVFALAGGEGVLRLGTISKTIAPGLRVGWTKGPTRLIDALIRMRFDNGTSPFAQYTVQEYVAAGVYRPHIDLVKGVYRKKYEAMDAGLGEHCSRFCSWAEPDGGFFLWLKLPDGVDCVSLLPHALDEGVGYFAGTSFYTDGGGADHIRLAYSAVNIDKIGEGCARLGRALARATA